MNDVLSRSSDFSVAVGHILLLSMGLVLAPAYELRQSTFMTRSTLLALECVLSPNYVFISND